MNHHRLLSACPAIGVSAPLAVTTYPATRSGAMVGRATTPAAAWRAIWSVTPCASGYATPVAAARGFAVSLLHMRAPVVATYSPRTPSTGVVAVRYAARVSPINGHVEHFAGVNGWWIVSCTTPQIDITSPVALSHMTSPVTLKGSSLAFEAVVNISLRRRAQHARGPIDHDGWWHADGTVRRDPAFCHGPSS
jgi:hypothetical protein